jgi:hypothetical protein
MHGGGEQNQLSFTTFISTLGLQYVKNQITI